MLKVVVHVTLLINFSMGNLDVFYDRVVVALDKNLDYLIGKYDEFYPDVLLGAVFATVFMEDALNGNNNATIRRDILPLLNKIHTIQENSLPKFLKQKNWEYDIVADPKVWGRPLKFQDGSLSSSIDFAVLSSIRSSLRGPKYESFVNLSSYCLRNIIEETANLRPKICNFGRCQSEMVDREDVGAGYIATHRLLFLQIAKQRKCLINENFYKSLTKKFCTIIFNEINNMEYFNQLGSFFDLFLEEIVLCGYEGFSDFFTAKILQTILNSQRKSGCFQLKYDNKIRIKTMRKRSFTVWEDGCSDHPTSLAMAVMGAFINFMIKTQQDI